MDELRLLLALACFCTGCYLVYDLFNSGFHWVVLGAALCMFVLAHFIKPKKEVDSDWSGLWELVDFVIDMPFKALVSLLRGLGRAAKSDGIDVDL